LAVVLVAWARTTVAAEIAAHIEAEEISIASVDAMASERVQGIHERLTATARHALEHLIDQRLGVDREPVESRARQRAERYRVHGVSLALPQPRVLESALPPEQIIAVVAGKPLRASELERAAALRLYRLRGELYLQRRRDLDRLIEQRLLEREAKRRGVSLASLEESLSIVEPLTDAQVADHVARERSAGRSIANPERLRPYLEFQQRYRRRADLLQARRAETKIRIDLRPPVRPLLAVDVRGGVALGARDGPTLVAYTNYSCAVCRAMHRELDRLLAVPRPPRVVLHDFAHDVVALEAAALVRCAAKNDRAASMRRLLLQLSPPRAGESWLNTPALESIAHVAGATSSALRTCIDAPEVRAQIERDTSTARLLGFDTPPGFVAAGVALSGMQSAEQLAKALRGNADSLSASN